MGPGIPLEQTPPSGAGTPGAGIPPGAGTSPPGADGYCCGWYASYWNAFLFSMHERKIAGNAEHKVMKPGFPN